MAEQIAEGLYRLDIPLPGNPLKNLNSYLLTGERNLLIDTGFRLDACREAMERQLRELGVDLERTDLFLTHLHTDHTGLAGELHRPGCRVYIGVLDGPLMEAGRGQARWDFLFEQYIRAGFTREELEEIWQNNPAKALGTKHLEELTLLEDGAELHYGGRRLQVLFTPGHTPGHVCLWEQERKILFCGDHVLFHITPNITRWDSMDDALGTYLTSLEKIRDLPAALLCPAHRQVEGGLAKRCEELRLHHMARLRDAREAVVRHPGETAYAITGFMCWEIRCRSWEDFPSTQKWFAVGEGLAHLDHLERLGQVESREIDGQVRWWPVPAEH